MQFIISRNEVVHSIKKYGTLEYRMFSKNEILDQKMHKFLLLYIPVDLFETLGKNKEILSPGFRIPQNPMS
jgi:hypothetical protein